MGLQLLSKSSSTTCEYWNFFLFFDIWWKSLWDGFLVSSVKLIHITFFFSTRGQAEKEFRVEVEAIGHVRHKNLVRLLGYCIEGTHRYCLSKSGYCSCTCNLPFKFNAFIECHHIYGSLITCSCHSRRRDYIICTWSNMKVLF